MTAKRPEPFRVKDCSLIIRMGGVDPAANLRELRQRITVCPLESLYHHFCETHIRATFDDPEFRNDIAVWASHHLRDRPLAERLGALNPYEFETLEALRERVLEILDQRLSEVSWVPWSPLQYAFRFMRAATVIFDTGVRLRGPEDLLRRLPRMSPSTLYFHFIEARRRTGARLDDFSAWLQELPSPPRGVIDALARVDFYFLTLPELRRQLLRELGLSEGRASRG
jgi:hypothetical protein